MSSERDSHVETNRTNEKNNPFVVPSVGKQENSSNVVETKENGDAVVVLRNVSIFHMARVELRNRPAENPSLTQLRQESAT